MVESGLFAFEGVGVSGSDGEVLRSVDLTLPDGGVSVVLGPSGSGKTTLLRLCNRLEAAHQGRVLFRGVDVATLDPIDLRRTVGMVFQKAVLFGGTVTDNLLVAVPGADTGTMTAALERAELPAEFLTRDADTLSGGEAQRVSIARTLIVGPSVLLMDEPTAALDGAPRLGLERLARRLVVEGVPIVWVTHDLQQARRLADHVVLMINGAVRTTGPPSLLDDAGDAAVAAFLQGDHAGR